MLSVVVCCALRAKKAKKEAQQTVSWLFILLFCSRECMRMPIPKLLSRKFNIDCVNVAGLLTRVRLPTFPPDREKCGAGSGFEEVTGIP
jgi:hypothetical protein